MTRVSVGEVVVYLNGSTSDASVTGDAPQWDDDSDATYATTSASNVTGAPYVGGDLTPDGTVTSGDLILHVRALMDSGNTGLGDTLQVHWFIGEEDAGATAVTVPSLGSTHDLSVAVSADDFDEATPFSDFLTALNNGTASVRVLCGSPFTVGPTNTATIYELWLGFLPELDLVCRTEEFGVYVDSANGQPVTTDNTILNYITGTWVLVDGASAFGAGGSGRLQLDHAAAVSTMSASIDFHPDYNSEGFGTHLSAMLELWTGVVDEGESSFVAQFHHDSSGDPGFIIWADTPGGGYVEYTHAIPADEAEQWFNVTARLTDDEVTFVIYDESGVVYWAPPVFDADGLKVYGMSATVDGGGFYAGRVDNMRLCVGDEVDLVIRQFPSTDPAAWGGGPRQFPAPTRRPIGGFQ